MQCEIHVTPVYRYDVLWEYGGRQIWPTFARCSLNPPLSDQQQKTRYGDTVVSEQPKVVMRQQSRPRPAEAVATQVSEV